MTTINATSSAYSIRIEDAGNWTLSEGSNRVLWAVDGMVNDNNAEATAASKPSEDVDQFGACFDGDDEANLRAFAAELAAQGW